MHARQVYKAVQDDVRTVAVKLSNKGSDGGAACDNMFWKEIELIAELRDRNLLQFYGAAITDVRQRPISMYVIVSGACIRSPQDSKVSVLRR